ncbi:hypothetical protein GWI33_020832 [Rhynchophorus ferrugineus]|uniref:Uncharacterized protein n=1 Tax=Rhynchophorus ferrugineus TaxID=354439 RepID=A0A834HPY0_RHYFE|nr:hypothetical protein GWI33_020832 [Rhynchophorus ferrugineus]
MRGEDARRERNPSRHGGGAREKCKLREVPGRKYTLRSGTDEWWGGGRTTLAVEMEGGMKGIHPASGVNGSWTIGAHAAFFTSKEATD